jgi:hypothetical protein
MILEHGADAKVQDKPLSLDEELDEGYVDFARVLARTRMPRTRSGQLYYTKASKEGRADAVCLLLEHGADVTAQNMLRYTPLEAARALLKHGAGAGGQAKRSRTPFPLHGAASFGGHVEIVRMLPRARRVCECPGPTRVDTAASGIREETCARDTSPVLSSRMARMWKAGTWSVGTLLARGAHCERCVSSARVFLDYGADKGRPEQGRADSGGLLYALPWASPGVFEELELLSNPNPLPRKSEAGHCCTMQ